MQLTDGLFKLVGPIRNKMSAETLKSVVSDLAIGVDPAEVVKKHGLSGEAEEWIYQDKQLSRFIRRYQEVIRTEVISKIRKAAKEAAVTIHKFFQEATEDRDRLKALEVILKYFVDLERIEVERERLGIDRQKARNEKRRFDIMRMKDALPNGQMDELGRMSKEELGRLLDNGARITGLDLRGVKDLEGVIDGVRVSGSEEREGPGSLDQGEDGGGEEDMATSNE